MVVFQCGLEKLMKFPIDSYGLTYLQALECDPFFQNNKKNLLSPSDRLIGDVVMLTGFLSYAGPFNQEFRTKLLSNWKKELADRKVPYSPDLHVTNTLVDQPTIGEWNLQGDVHSLFFLSCSSVVLNK